MEEGGFGGRGKGGGWGMKLIQYFCVESLVKYTEVDRFCRLGMYRLRIACSTSVCCWKAWYEQVKNNVQCICVLPVGLVSIG